MKVGSFDLSGADMAHLEKFKAHSIGHMLAHYTRSRDAVLERDNIDEMRSDQNFTIDDRDASWDLVKKRIEGVESSTGRKVRKDAVVMADMVITAPANVSSSDLEEFFKQSYIYMAQQVGVDNLMGGFVHMDETTPHMHVPFTPIKDGRFNFKQLCPRSFYQNFHKGLGDHLERTMGYRPEIELSEERKAEKVLSDVPQAQLDDARAALLAPLPEQRAALEREYEERVAELEAVKRELAMREEQRQALNRGIYELREEHQQEQDRLEELQQRTGEVAGRVEELRSVASDARGFQDASRSGKSAILDRIAGKCDGIREQVMERKAELGKAVNELRGRVDSALRRIREMSKPRRQATPQSDYDCARRAPQVMPQSRSFSRGR